MLQTSCNTAVQKAVLAQIAKGAYQAPSVSTLKLDSVGRCGPLALAGNQPTPQ
jgi:hypothetical protein